MVTHGNGIRCPRTCGEDATAGNPLQALAEDDLDATVPRLRQEGAIKRARSRTALHQIEQRGAAAHGMGPAPGIIGCAHGHGLVAEVRAQAMAAHHLQNVRCAAPVFQALEIPLKAMPNFIVSLIDLYPPAGAGQSDGRGQARGTSASDFDDCRGSH